MKATNEARSARIVTHEQARESALKFINAHFRNPGRDKPRATIPPELTDDDIVLMDYINQQEADDAKDLP